MIKTKKKTLWLIVLAVGTIQTNWLLGGDSNTASETGMKKGTGTLEKMTILGHRDGLINLYRFGAFD